MDSRNGAIRKRYRNKFGRNTVRIWTKALTELFIGLLQKNDCLHCVESPLYYNKEKRLEALKDILAEMQPMCSALTLDELKIKMKSLRTQYCREMRRIKITNEYEPKLWCFDQLHFLAVSPKIEPPQFFEKAVKESEDVAKMSAQKAQMQAGVKEKVRKLSIKVKKFISAREARNLHRANENGTYDWLFKNMKEQFYKLSPDDQEEAAVAIQLSMMPFTKRRLAKSANPTTTKSISKKSINNKTPLSVKSSVPNEPRSPIVSAVPVAIHRTSKLMTRQSHSEQITFKTESSEATTSNVVRSTPRKTRGIISVKDLDILKSATGAATSIEQ